MRVIPTIRDVKWEGYTLAIPADTLSREMATPEDLDFFWRQQPGPLPQRNKPRVGTQPS